MAEPEDGTREYVKLVEELKAERRVATRTVVQRAPDLEDQPLLERMKGALARYAGAGFATSVYAALDKIVRLPKATGIADPR